jgi:hypothetical protein
MKAGAKMRPPRILLGPPSFGTIASSRLCLVRKRNTPGPQNGFKCRGKSVSSMAMISGLAAPPDRRIAAAAGRNRGAVMDSGAGLVNTTTTKVDINGTSSPYCKSPIWLWSAGLQISGLRNTTMLVFADGLGRPAPLRLIFRAGTLQ